MNNPPVGLVTAEMDHLNGRRTCQFDPTPDPQLHWAGKVEDMSFAGRAGNIIFKSYMSDSSRTVGGRFQ
jgi:hypothetical protein